MTSAEFADQEEEQTGWSWGRVIIWAVAFQLMCLVYLPGLHGPFIFDDLGAIVQNEDLRHLDEPWRLFRDHESSLEFDRRPVTALSFMLNYQVFELNPFGYRIVNLFLHWFAAMVLAAVVNQLARLMAWKGGWNLGLVVAHLWLFHPIATNVTTFIYQRSELLMSMFYLVAILAVLKAGRAGERERVWVAVALLAAAAAILSKEPGITLLVALPLVEWVAYRWRLREWIQRRGAMYLLLAAGCGLAAWWFAGGIRVEENSGGSVLAHPLEYFKTQCGVLLRYLRLVVWPHPMIFFAQPRYIESGWNWIPQMLVLSALFGGLIAAGLWWRWLWIPVGVFLIVLAPTSSFFPVPLEPEVGFRMYLPSAAVIALLVVGAWRILALHHLGRRLGVGLVLVCGLALAVSTFLRNHDHRTSRAFWESVVRHDTENIKAMNNLALEYINDGDLDEAVVVARRLLEVGRSHRSEFAFTSGQRLEALIWLESGEAAKAERVLADLARNAPWLEGVKLNLALAAMRVGKLEHAGHLLSRAESNLKNSPSFWMLESELAARQGDKQRAQAILRRIEHYAGEKSPRVRALRALIDSQKRSSTESKDN